MAEQAKIERAAAQTRAPRRLAAIELARCLHRVLDVRATARPDVLGAEALRAGLRAMDQLQRRYPRVAAEPRVRRHQRRIRCKIFLCKRRRRSLCAARQQELEKVRFPRKTQLQSAPHPVFHLVVTPEVVAAAAGPLGWEGEAGDHGWCALTR